MKICFVNLDRETTFLTLPPNVQCGETFVVRFAVSMRMSSNIGANVFTEIQRFTGRLLKGTQLKVKQCSSNALNVDNDWPMMQLT